jgi:Skp family chaperone for outer membrane proteins
MSRFTFLLLPLLGLAIDARAAEPLPIALVNMDRLFKSYPPLQEKLAPLKEEAKQLEERLQLRQAELETAAAKLRKLQPGSPELQQQQVQLVKLQNELRQFVETERQSLQKKEAAIYLNLYRRVEEVVAKHAKANGIKLVIRQQESSLDPEQPLAEILKTLNRGIVYEEGLDITDDVLKALSAAPTLER